MSIIKSLLDGSLNDITLELSKLNEYKKVYFELKKNKNNDELNKSFKKIQLELRKELYNEVEKIGYFKEIFSEKFIKKVLKAYLKTENKENDFELVKKFENWNTYFVGFYENRKNVFSTKEIPTSIFYRIINDNLPKFLENSLKLEKLREYNDFKYSQLERDFKNELKGLSIEEFFSLNNFSNFLNQNGINKFNLVIGGKNLEENKKIQGINELINLYSQQEDKFKDKNEIKKFKKLKFEILFKQILSDVESDSFKFEVINSENEVLNKIKTFIAELDLKEFKNSIVDLLNNLNEFDLKEIYIRNDQMLSTISNHIFNDYSKIELALLRYAESNLINLKGKKEEKFNKWVKNTKYFSIYEIEEGLRLLDIINTTINKDKEKNISVIEDKKFNNLICLYFSKFLSRHKNSDEEYQDIFNVINNNMEEFNNLLKIGFSKEKEVEVKIIKEYLDSIRDLFYFIKPLNLGSKKDQIGDIDLILEKDNHFYDSFNKLYSKIEKIIPLYNQVRNFVTKKKFETKKFKLNFYNPTLLMGWDFNKVKDNSSIIFRKNGLYYLGIMSRGNNKSFDNISEKYSKNLDTFFEKLNYKLVSGANKMLPHVFLSSKGIKTFNPSKEILELYKNGEHKKGDKFKIESCHKLIDYFKSCVSNYKANPKDKYGWEVFNFKFSDTKEYEDISYFYREFETQSYKIWFENISKEYVDDLVKKGELYLFQIYSKDFSPFSKGRKNLNSIYWEEIFSPENIKNIIYKLNGEAEIFYRKKSIPLKITHYKNHKIENKDPIDNKKESIFKFDLIKDKRYTENKFLFHCPITLNFKSPSNNYMINFNVNQIIKDNLDEINILGIDRGERNLAYWALLDSKGNLKKQGSFNLVKDDKGRKPRDYHQKLDELEKGRDKERKSWNKIGNIKDLKQGYLSQIIHEIAKMVIEENAIIVFEDLNFGFKKGRFKIEKQVYQKFEKMLIDKLNYLVFKDRKKEVVGGSLKAYQLTSKFESFEKLGKQTGIMYYVDANYTSKICPKTGFINRLYPKYENLNQAKLFLKNFEYINYHQDNNLFEFNFNYSKFGFDNLKKDNWSIYSNGIKIKRFRDKEKKNSWVSKEEDITKNLRILFSNNNINYENQKNILNNILILDKPEFFKGLFYNLSLILQLRNSYLDYELKTKLRDGSLKNELEGDYILSCVKDKSGNFFDSRKAKDNEPKDADANGAYNIGVKGLMVINKIKNSTDITKLKSKNLKISREEFVNFIINRDI